MQLGCTQEAERYFEITYKIQPKELACAMFTEIHG
jgi:hypothetical protein